MVHEDYDLETIEEIIDNELWEHEKAQLVDDVLSKMKLGMLSDKQRQELFNCLIDMKELIADNYNVVELTTREREILMYRKMGWTLQRIGNFYDITRERVRVIEKKAKAKLERYQK